MKTNSICSQLEMMCLPWGVWSCACAAVHGDVRPMLMAENREKWVDLPWAEKEIHLWDDRGSINDWMGGGGGMGEEVAKDSCQQTGKQRSICWAGLVWYLLSSSTSGMHFWVRGLVHVTSNWCLFVLLRYRGEVRNSNTGFWYISCLWWSAFPCQNEISCCFLQCF